MTTTKKPGLPVSTQLSFEGGSWAKLWEKAVKVHGGWDPKAGTLAPVQKVEKLIASPTYSNDFSAWFVADSLCAAYEAGVLTAETLLEAFATPQDLEAFIGFLLNNSRYTWVNERHFHAFVGLGAVDEDAGTYELISDWFRDHVLAEAD